MNEVPRPGLRRTVEINNSKGSYEEISIPFTPEDNDLIRKITGLFPGCAIGIIYREQRIIVTSHEKDQWGNPIEKKFFDFSQKKEK